MTINTESTKRIYVGNGTTTDFDYDFKIFVDTDLRVTLIDAAGNETVQVLNTDYTVTGEGFEAGGKVKFTSAPAAGVTVLIQSDVPYTQPTDFKNQGRFFPETHENAFDRAARQALQVREKVDRALKLPAYVTDASTDLPTPDPAKVIGWAQDGKSLANYSIADLGTTLAFSDFHADVFTATAARTDFTLSANPGALANLDVSINGVTKVPGVDYTLSGTTLSFVTPMTGGEKVLARYGTALPVGVADSSAVQFLQSGAGAVTRTAQDKMREIVTPEDFGAIGDGTTHPLSERYATLADARVDYPFATSLTQEIDYCAIMAAINSRTFGTGYYISGPTIRLRDGATYYCGSSTIELKRSVRITGADSGLPTTSGPAIKFAADTRGIVVHRYNTIGNTKESVPTTAGDGSVLEGFRLLGGGGTDATAHGFHLRARAVIERLYVNGFAGNGGHIVASSGGANDVEGNANNFKLDTLRIQNSGGHGLYVNGADANAGVVVSLDASANGKSGIYDSSFLGNTYIGCHTASNGKKSQVHYAGNRYYCVDDALGGSTTPGTNANVWALIGAGGVSSIFPDWQSGGTYYIGAAYRTDNTNARNLFLGCYAEGGQPYSMLVTPALVVGGLFGSLHNMGSTTSPFIEGASGKLRVNRGVETLESSASATVTARLGGDASNGDLLSFTHSTAGPNIWRFRVNGNDLDFNYQNSAANTAFKVTGPNTALTFGRSAPVPHAFQSNRLWIGNGNNARNHTSGTAAPTTGEYAKGDICWNANPSAGGNVGWVCTAAGTPGTWVPFGYANTELSGSKTYDWPDLPTATQQTTTVTVMGAALGDYAEASMSVDLAGTELRAYVSAADTVTVVHRNDTGANVNLASGTLRVRVRKS